MVVTVLVPNARCTPPESEHGVLQGPILTWREDRGREWAGTAGHRLTHLAARRHQPWALEAFPLLMLPRPGQVGGWALASPSGACVCPQVSGGIKVRTFYLLPPPFCLPTPSPPPSWGGEHSLGWGHSRVPSPSCLGHGL